MKVFSIHYIPESNVPQYIVSALRGSHLPDGEVSLFTGPVALRHVFQWRAAFGAGDTKEGFGCMWGCKGSIPAEVRSGVGWERT